MRTRSLTLPLSISGFIHLCALFFANSYLNFDITLEKKEGLNIPVKFVQIGNQYDETEIKKSNLEALQKIVEKEDIHEKLIKFTQADKTSETRKEIDFRQEQEEGDEKTKLFVKKTHRPQPDEEMEAGLERSIVPKIILNEKTLPEKFNVMEKLVKPETQLEITAKADVEEKAAIKTGNRVKTITETISKGKNVSGIQNEIEKGSELHDVTRVERKQSEIGHKMEANPSGNIGEEKIAAIKKGGLHGKPTEKDVMVEAIMLDLKEPRYPRVSRKRNEEGKIILSVEVYENGESGKIKVINSSGFSRLDRAAVKALEQAVFIPAKIDGKPIISIKQIAFVFKLEDS